VLVSIKINSCRFNSGVFDRLEKVILGFIHTNITHIVYKSRKDVCSLRVFCFFKTKARNLAGLLSVIDA